MTALVPDFILRQDARGQTEGRFTAAGLFVDISGFTLLTERLMQHGRAGAEALATVLRLYFDPLVAAVHEAGGFITGFAGDAFTALFPEAEDRDAALHAAFAAAQMQRFFREHPLHTTRHGQFSFGIKIGLAWGPVDWGIVYVHSRRAYSCFHGAVLDACAAVEHRAEPGDVLLDRGFFERMPAGAAAPAGERFELLCPPPMQPVQASEARPVGDGPHFLASGLEALPWQGEFRSVASVFLSFEQGQALPQLIRLLHELGERYGGTFTGLDSGDKGDNCLIHFGAPRAHENDAERAVDFALELRQRCAEPRPDARSPVRAGVTFGLRYAGFNGGTERHEFACLGRATNLAARLMMQAPWGEIWCSPEVFGRLQHGYRWQERGGFLFKGFDAPVSVHSVERKRTVIHREFAAREMVGRDAELEQLAQSVEPIYSGRFAGLVYVDGEPGLGKSYLVETFHRRLGAERQPGSFSWIEAPCEQTLKRSFNPFECALKQRFGQSSTSSRAENRASLDQRLDELIERLASAEAQHAAPLCQELERLRSVLAVLVGLHSEGSLYEQLNPKMRYENTVLAIKSWVQAEASLKPVVLHIEDAHSIDADSRQAVRALARSAEGFPIAVLCTGRLLDDGTPFRIDVSSDVPQRTLDLGHLSEADLRRLAELQLEAPVSPALTALLAEKAAGNPFFAEQILAHLRAQDQLRQTRDGLAPAASDLVLPQDVDTLLIARLDRLAAGVKQTVQTASVLGIRFAVPVLSAMLLEDSQLERKLRNAEEERIWTAVDPTHYSFRQELLRDAAYEMQARARLQDLHRRAAEAIELVHTASLDEQHPALGHHWERAEVPDKARPHYLAGARRARDRYAQAEAERLYRAYLALVEVPSAEAVEARNELGHHVLRLQGRSQEAIAEHKLALEEARALGDRALEGHGLLELGILHRQVGPMQEAHDFFERALALAREIGDRRLEGLVLTDLANLYGNEGRPEASALFEQALSIQRELGNRKVEGGILSNLANLASDQGRLQEAGALYEQALAILSTIGDRQFEGILLGNLAVLHERQGRPVEAVELYGRALAAAREVGFRLFEGVTLGNIALLQHQQGRSEEALGLYERALAILREVGSKRFEANNLVNLANVHRAQGRLLEARALYEQALAIHRAIGNRQFEGITLAYQAALERLDGRIAEADGLLDQAERILKDVGDALSLAIACCERGHTALALGRPAAQFLQQAQDLARSVDVGPESELGKALARLRNAIDASEAGRTLLRGECAEDIPMGLRLRLVGAGQLSSGEISAAGAKPGAASQ